MRPLASACTLVIAVGFARAAAAAPCPPGATLVGEPALVSALGELLDGRGVALDPPGCATVRVAVSARSTQVVLELEHDGRQVERVVDDAATAATVIESFARIDVAMPLLAERAAPPRIEPTPSAAPAAEPTLVDGPARPGAAGLRRVQVFAGLDSAIASDGTRWLGAQLGVCIQLGPICAAARQRFGQVAGGPGAWGDDLSRRAIELLIGIDVPLTLGPVALSPGFATGIGQIHTRRSSTEVRNETGGLRADVHATVSLAVAHRLTLDLFAAAVLTQATHVEGPADAAELPDEPRLLGHLGLGLRYGGL
ncbi:MAG: hypothetical protein IPL61_11510 [Myxococcales bacterium]|nr:hypothetical protein [Myxococcales bacterium]